jgi:hypothetical protein
MARRYFANLGLSVKPSCRNTGSSFSMNLVAIRAGSANDITDDSISRILYEVSPCMKKYNSTTIAVLSRNPTQKHRMIINNCFDADI